MAGHEIRVPRVIDGHANGALDTCPSSPIHMPMRLDPRQGATHMELTALSPIESRPISA